MAFSRLFCDSFRRNRLAVLVLLPVFFATAAILFIGMPMLQRYAAYHYGIGFADGYDLIATNVAKGNGYRWRSDMAETMIREPGYPLLLAAALKIAGYRIEAARLLNLLLTVGIAVMLMALARRMTGDPRTPVIAALLFLVHPGTLIAEARGGAEIPFIFVGFGFMLALHWAVEKGGLWPYFLAGLAFGVVVQVRSTPRAFPVLLLLYALFTAKGAREHLMAAVRVAILVVGMCLVIVPWVVRNYRLVHEFVPASTLGGIALQEGLDMCRHVSFGVDLYPVGQAAGRKRGELARELGMRFEGAEYFQMFYDAHDETAFDRILYETATKEYARNPGLLVGCIGKNLFNFWFLGKTWAITKLNMLVQVPLLAILFCGLGIVWRRGDLRKMGILLIYVGSIAITHLLVVAEARYSIPVLAFLTIPAAIAVTSIWDGIRKTHEVRMTTQSAVWARAPYCLKPEPYSSHSLLLAEFPLRGEGRRVLDVGCAQGYLSEILAKRGFHVVSIDQPDTPHSSTIEFAGTDLDNGLPPLTGLFDYVICADVLEHLRAPLKLLKECRSLLAPSGVLLGSLPNSGHAWFRWNVLRGRFPQDERGLFDRTHLHFYTWEGWVALFNRAGLRIERVRPSSVPLQLAFPRWSRSAAMRALERLSFKSAHIWKELFAYQFIVCAAEERTE